MTAGVRWRSGRDNDAAAGGRGSRALEQGGRGTRQQPGQSNNNTFYANKFLLQSLLRWSLIKKSP